MPLTWQHLFQSICRESRHRSKEIQNEGNVRKGRGVNYTELLRAISLAGQPKACPRKGWMRFHSETQGKQLSIQLHSMLPICKNEFNKGSIYHLFKACLLLLCYILLLQGAAFSYLPRWELKPPEPWLPNTPTTNQQPWTLWLYCSSSKPAPFASAEVLLKSTK